MLLQQQAEVASSSRIASKATKAAEVA